MSATAATCSLMANPCMDETSPSTAPLATSASGDSANAQANQGATAQPASATRALSHSWTPDVCPAKISSNADARASPSAAKASVLLNPFVGVCTVSSALTISAASSRSLRPRYDSKALVPAPGKGILTVREQKVLQMMALAEEMGYVCEPQTKYRHEFIQSVNSHLIHREGKNVYQSAAFNLPLFARQAALSTFGLANITTNTSSCVTWELNSMMDLTGFFGDMMSEAGKNSAGLTRALQTASEPTSRVLAMIIPPMTVSHVELARGVSRLYINLMYILSDEAGEIHFGPRTTTGTRSRLQWRMWPRSGGSSRRTRAS